MVIPKAGVILVISTHTRETMHSPYIWWKVYHNAFGKPSSQFWGVPFFSTIVFIQSPLDPECDPVPANSPILHELYECKSIFD